MNAEELRELWARFLAGETLPAEAQRELVQALEADPALRETLLEDGQLDGMLRAAGATRRDGEVFARTIADCLAPERDATRFVKKVEERVLETTPPEPPTAGLPAVRESRLHVTRFLRRLPRSGSSALGWKIGLSAAGVFVFIVALAVSWPRKQDKIVRQIPAPATQELDREKPETAVRPAPPKLPPPKPLPEPDVAPRPEVKVEPRLPEREKPRETPPPPPTPEPRPKTVAPEAAVAVDPPVLEKIENDIFVARSPANKERAREGSKLPPGLQLESVNDRSSAVLRFSDGTRVEMIGLATLRVEFEEKARKVFLSYGVIESVIAPQPADRPMIFVAPHAEAVIVGTSIRLTVSRDDKLGTTLEVKEGKVQFKRLIDGKTADVGAGAFAVAASGQELEPKLQMPDEIKINFGPANLPAPGYLNDDGSAFSSKRGYGWVSDKDGTVLTTYTDPAGKPIEVKAGRGAVQRGDLNRYPVQKVTHVAAGWGSHSETWIMPVPNGHYQVKVSVGDSTFEQGPHFVTLENKAVIRDIMTRPSKADGFHLSNDIVEVRDGVLTMVCGGSSKPRRSSDGSMDTILNYIEIKRVRK